MRRHGTISPAAGRAHSPASIAGHGLLTLMLAAFLSVPGPAWGAAIVDGNAANADAAQAEDLTSAPSAGSIATEPASAASTAEPTAATPPDAPPHRTATVALGGSEADPSIFAGGTGTAADPYQIADVAQLLAFRDAVNNGSTFAGETVKLTAFTYDLSGSQWTPIGAGTRNGSGFTGTSFQGVFDGGGATITGLTLSGTFDADQALGLFGVVAGGTVQDLVLQQVAMDATANQCVGAAVGLLTEGGLVENVTVNGQVTAARGCGGVVGRLTLNGTIEHCTNHAVVTAAGGANVGGIVGAAYYTTLGEQMSIAHCTNTAAINGRGVAGGIVGLSAASVQDCTNTETATVTSNNFSVGGIVGEQQNYGQISGCVNHGAIANTSGTGYGTGGIVGWVRYNGQATDYARSGEVSVSQNINTAAIKGGTGTAGIAGCVFNAATVTHNTNMAATLTASTFVAGVVGDFQTYTTPIGSVPKDELIVTDNISTTPLDAMTGSDKAQYVYANGNPVTMRDNTDALPTEPAKDPDGTDGSGRPSTPDGADSGSSGGSGAGGGASSGATGGFIAPPRASSEQGPSTANSSTTASAGEAADGGNSLALADEFAEGRSAADEHDQALADEENAVRSQYALDFPLWGLVLLGLLLAAAIAALVVVVRKYRAHR